MTEQRPVYRRWFIQFQVLREGSDDYVEKYYSCIVDPEGNVIGDPDINEKSVFEYAENKQSSVIATVTNGLAGLAQIAAKRFKTRQAKRKLQLFYYCW